MKESVLFRDHADRAVVFQDRRPDCVQVGMSGFVDGGDEFLTRDLGVGQDIFINLAVMEEHLRIPFDELLHRLAGGGDPADDPVRRDQGDGEDHSRRDRVVAAIHRVLHRVAEHHQKDQIEGAHLPDLTFAGRPQQKDQEEINQKAPSDEFPPVNRHIPHASRLAEAALRFHTFQVVIPSHDGDVVQMPDGRLQED